MLDLPFTTAEFHAVFARYNLAVAPMQVVLLMLALGCVATLAFRVEPARRLIAWTLALLWAWMGVAYHFAFFAAINPAAWGFGALFLVAALIFGWHAARGALVFRWSRGWRGTAGAAIVAYALVGYPVLGGLLGARYPQVPTFGLPCPTTLFTLGMLMFAVHPVPRAVVVIPVVWSVIGTVAAFALGVRADLGLAVAAVLALAGVLSNAGTPVASSGRHAPVDRIRSRRLPDPCLRIDGSAAVRFGDDDRRD